MRSGVQLVMSSPRRRTLPAEALSSPDNRLTSVDFPAPLGPMMAWMPWVPNSSATPSTAIKPPKRRVRFAVERIASSIVVLLANAGAPARRERLWQSSQSPRKKQHRDDDEATHQERPMLGQRREPFLKQDVGEGADHRAEKRAHPAQDQHHEHYAGLVPGHELRIDVAFLGGREISRKPGQRAGEDERRELVAPRCEAQRAHALFVGLDALQGASERRAQDQRQKEENAGEQGEH